MSLEVISENPKADSVVVLWKYASWKKSLFKHYHSIWRRTIREYAQLQNILSSSKKRYRVSSKVSLYLQDVDEVVVRILSIPKDASEVTNIQSRKPELVVMPDFIDGPNLYSHRWDFSPEFRKLVGSILEDYFQKLIKSTWINVSSVFAENVKISGFQNGIVELTVTDVSNSIWRFVDENQNVIKSS